MQIKNLIALRKIELDTEVQNERPPTVEYYITEYDEYDISAYQKTKYYGICVSKLHNDAKREEVTIPFISKNKKHVDNIIEILIRNTVTPISLKDVLKDMNFIFD